ncbi:hypothetical protein [Pseudomonas sp. PLMAX]
MNTVNVGELPQAAIFDLALDFLRSKKSRSKDRSLRQLLQGIAVRLA